MIRMVGAAMSGSNQEEHRWCVRVGRLLRRSLRLRTVLLDDGPEGVCRRARFGELVAVEVCCFLVACARLQARLNL